MLTMKCGKHQPPRAERKESDKVYEEQGRARLGWAWLGLAWQGLAGHGTWNSLTKQGNKRRRENES